ncbi:MAG TPA: sigma-70 family RNA polymerase sigma factor [Sphingomonas sp.]|jgi:RNA polymerase sigma-70 factor (ECF subfamily)|uniref:sigma-70 family RNA polymerase sigma factor n=1 Tax=Sphingomonas sp. TaxID=28214 RepID=UPI002ED9D5D7
MSRTGPPLDRDTAAGAGSSEIDRAVLVALLVKVAGRDRIALEGVYQRTSTKLFGICLRILGDRDHAEEALQETYLSIWRNAEAFDPARGTAMTWLMTLARNCAIDRRRVLARGGGGSALDTYDPVDPAPDPFAQAATRDEDRRLHLCLDRLDAADRRHIAAAFFEGISYSEIAVRGDTPLPTIKSRIRRALMKLKACLA